MVLLWFFQALPMVVLWFPFGAYDIPMSFGFLWFSMAVLRLSHGFLWFSFGFLLIAISWSPGVLVSGSPGLLVSTLHAT